MRLIDANNLLEEMGAGCIPILEKGISQVTGDESTIKDYIDQAPTVDAEPVRHTENTTVIDTDDVSKWKSRVMVCERNSHWGRLYYESDTKHGQWATDAEDIEWGNSLKRKHCTNCGKRPHFDKEKREFVLTNYCPHCGAKMDLEV